MYEQELWVLCSITNILDSTVCLTPGTVFSMKSHDFSLQTLSGLAAACMALRLVTLQHSLEKLLEYLWTLV